MMTGEQYNVSLQDDEAELFKQFRQFQDVFSVIVKSGVFNIAGGKATLEFDFEGRLREIKVRNTTYRYTKKEDPLRIEVL